VGDFQGKVASVEAVARSGLDVYAHNLETVRELTEYVRDRRANYDQTLETLRLAKELVPSMVTKSALMVGCGETEDQVYQTIEDLLKVDCGILTIGQYLRPTPAHMPVHEYVHPDVFQKYKEKGEEMGLTFIASGPLVRSSYRAGEFFLKNFLEKRRDEGVTVV